MYVVRFPLMSWFGIRGFGVSPISCGVNVAVWRILLQLRRRETIGQCCILQTKILDHAFTVCVADDFSDGRMVEGACGDHVGWRRTGAVYERAIRFNSQGLRFCDCWISEEEHKEERYPLLIGLCDVRVHWSSSSLASPVHKCHQNVLHINSCGAGADRASRT